MNLEGNAVTSGTVGIAVRLHRVEQGVTLSELAARVGVSAATVSAVENGKTGVSVHRLQQFAAALSVSPAELLAGSHRGIVGSARRLDGALGMEADQDWRDFQPLEIDVVLQAAIQAFVATGYHGASMRSIAKLAKISVPGVYHHYASKQSLLLAILDLTMRDLIWRVEKASTEAAAATDRLRLTVEALALYHTRRSELAFIGASEMRSLDSDNYRYIAAMRDQVQHLVEQNLSDAARQLDLDLSARSSMGKAIATMCTALPQWFRPQGPVSAEEIAEEYAGFALRLLEGR